MVLAILEPILELKLVILLDKKKVRHRISHPLWLSILSIFEFSMLENFPPVTLSIVYFGKYALIYQLTILGERIVSRDGLPRGVLSSSILKIEKYCPGLKVPVSHILCLKLREIQGFLGFHGPPSTAGQTLTVRDHLDSIKDESFFGEIRPKILLLTSDSSSIKFDHTTTRQSFDTGFRN